MINRIKKHVNTLVLGSSVKEKKVYKHLFAWHIFISRVDENGDEEEPINDRKEVIL